MLRDLPARPRNRSSIPSYPAALLAIALAACGGSDPLGLGEPGGDIAPPFGGSGGAEVGGAAGQAGNATGGTSQGGTSQGGTSQGGTSQGGSSGYGGELGGAAPAAFEDGYYCSDDYSCTSNTCLESTGSEFAGGGPARGMCSTSCTDFLLGKVSESPCSADTACVSISSDPQQPEAWCMVKCTPGSDYKCLSRTDMACVPQQDGGICMPLCAIDADCYGGVCDPASGLCRPPGTVITGAPIGSPCDPSAEPDTCAGVCHADSADPTAGVCTRACSVGNPDACGPGATCVGVIPDAKTGDLGVCRLIK